MDLEYIKENKCPMCGCNVIIEERVQAARNEMGYRTHAHGGRWESRKFACGQELNYCPNFSKVEISQYNICQKNEEYIIKQQKREQALKEIKKFILTLDVDEDYKEHLREKY
ncbi:MULTISPECIES: hypothetical protein [unclassified Clostridium]|uniref:hypothetical protein n=1 Tax=unclassified Clostridium TaxID=2614128 RepID=UPI0025B8914C|nr:MULTISPECIES: hypothetical protein [unclassified Clostridium]